MSNDLVSDWPGAHAAEAMHLHAIGAITLNYNNLEFTLSFLLGDYLGVKQDTSELIHDRLNNRDRVDVLRNLIQASETDEEVREHALYGLLCFDICTENRNALIHAIHQATDEATTDLLTRKRSSDKSHDVLYRLSLAALRKVADEIYATLVFVLDITGYLHQRALAPQVEASGEPLDETDLPALPRKPPRPDKLTPLPRSAAHAGDALPP